MYRNTSVVELNNVFGSLETRGCCPLVDVWMRLLIGKHWMTCAPFQEQIDALVLEPRKKLRSAEKGSLFLEPHQSAHFLHAELAGVCLSSPRREDEPGTAWSIILFTESCCWKPSRWLIEGVILHWWAAIRDRSIDSGVLGSSSGASTSNDKRIGYQGWLGHTGAIRFTVASCKLAFWRTWWGTMVVVPILVASVAVTSGSGLHLKNCGAVLTGMLQIGHSEWSPNVV